MKVKLTAAGIALATFVGAQAIAKPNPYSHILKRLIPPNVNYTVKVEKNSKIKGFDQLNIAIKDEKHGIVIHRYLWISKDKKEIIPVLLGYKNGMIYRIQPNNPIKRIPVDLGWIKNLLNELPASAKKSYGKGIEVYMFSDPLCPFCKRQLPELVKLAKEGKIKLHILPFNVHGKTAEEASAIFLDIESKKGLKAAIDKVENASFSDVENLVKNTKDVSKLTKKYSPVMKKIFTAAAAHGINGTPVTIVFTSKDKGYILIGVSNVGAIINKNKK